MKTKVVLITPEIAARWLSNNSGNRRITPSRVSALASEMSSGRWILTGQAVQLDSTGRLIDGQHRLSAVVQSGVSVQMLVANGVDRSAQVVIDTGKTRSFSDVLTMNGIGNSDTRMPAVVRAFICGGTKWPSPIPNQVLLNIYMAYQATLEEAASLMPKSAAVACVVAAMARALVYGLYADVYSWAAIYRHDALEDEPYKKQVRSLEKASREKRKKGARDSYLQMFLNTCRSIEAFSKRIPLKNVYGQEREVFPMDFSQFFNSQEDGQ